MKTAEAKVEVYVMAFQALSDEEKLEVIGRLLEDPQLREDAMDIAVLITHRGETGRPIEHYLAERKAKART